MRIVSAFIVALLSACCAFGEASTPVTLLVQFDGAYSPTVYDSMRQELSSVLDTAGIRLSLRDLKEATGLDEAGGLVVVRFRGACKIDSLPGPTAEAGVSLASTYSSDGDLLPFADVACDRVRDAVKRALQGGQYSRAESLYGRALARVLAHELYHILGKTAKHANGGVARAALSGRDLIADKLSFHPEDVHRMKGL